MSPVPELQQLVSLGCRVLGAADQGDLIRGHVSARDPEGRGVTMKAAGLRFDEVGPEDDVLVSWDGEVRSGRGRRHSEYAIHTEVMRARPDVGAVVAAYLLESACGAQLLAMSAGGWATWSPPDESLAQRAHCNSPTLIEGVLKSLVRASGAHR